MRIKVDKKKCSGCHLCEVICSLYHTGSVNIEKSAIQVLKDDLNTSMNRPVVCRQCKEMTCLNGENAKGSVQKKTFIWKRARAKRCPFGALAVFGKHAFHCDLCGGRPQCIRVCTTGAIRI